MKTKTCSHCKQTKDIFAFPRKKKSSDGRDWWCRDCWHIKNTKYGRAIKKYALASWHPDLPLEAHRRIRNMIHNANKRGGNLRVGDVIDMCVKFCKTHYHVWEPAHPFLPSIDRIDNDRGYHKDNIRIVWYIENLCRNRFSVKDVDLFCRLKLKS